MEDTTLASVLGRLEYAEERSSLDFPSILVPADKLIEALTVLRDEFSFNFLSDVTAIDWSQEASPRFTGVYHLLSTTQHTFFRVSAHCIGDEDPVLPSVVELWPAANWHERETYDMFGIRYENHPDLRRILMWDGYPYFPLRKEFPLAGIETELPADDVAEATQEQVEPAPMMGGPFFASQGGPMSKREPRAADQSWSEAKPRPTAETPE